MCKIHWTSWNSHRGEGVIISITVSFFLNICRMSLVCQLGDMVVNPDSFIAEITNRPKEMVDFFLWFSIQALWFYRSELGYRLGPISRKMTCCESWPCLRLGERKMSVRWDGMGTVSWCRRLRGPWLREIYLPKMSLTHYLSPRTSYLSCLCSLFCQTYISLKIISPITKINSKKSLKTQREILKNVKIVHHLTPQRQPLYIFDVFSFSYFFLLWAFMIVTKTDLYLLPRCRF